jgi:hypothetical protein
MTKIQIKGKQVNASVCHNVAVVKQKGYRCYHYPTLKTLGDLYDTRVFDNKEHAERFAWELQETYDLNVKSKEQFLSKNGGLTFDEYRAKAEEIYERTKL